MAATLVVCVVPLSLLAWHLLARGHGLRGAAVRAAVFWGALLCAITEVLGLLGQLTGPAVLAAWLLVCAAAGWSARRIDRRRPAAVVAKVRAVLSGGWTVAPLLGVAALVVVVGAIGVMAPPNNWDSMTYHMGRVAHWVQNRSVAHYPTNILRQLHQAPWAEYAIAHLYLLAGGDRLANLVQWGGFVGSIAGVSLIARQLGSGRHGQVVAAVFAATLPMAILQGSGTQNDLIAGFWMVCVVSLGISISSTAAPTRLDLVALGAALGLAVLTKATAYPFLFPFLVWLAARYWRKAGAGRALRGFGVVSVVALALNVAFFARNIEVYGSPLGPGEESGEYRYTNAVYTPGSLVSNTVRNLALHLGTVSRLDYTVVEPAIRRAHGWMGVDPDDPRTTWPGVRFRVPHRSYHEDSAGNPLHLGLVVLALATLIRRRRREGPLLAVAYAASVATAFVLFSFMLKWQPWHSRLHLPLFLLSGAFVGWAAESFRTRWVARAIAPLLLVAAVPWLVGNTSRSLTGPRAVYRLPRTEQYFANRPELEAGYRRAASLVRATGCRHVGVISGENDYEYPIWPLLQAGGARVRIEHAMVDNASAERGSPGGSAAPPPCALISILPEPPRAPFRLGGTRFTPAWAGGGIAVLLPAGEPPAPGPPPG